MRWNWKWLLVVGIALLPAAVLIPTIISIRSNTALRKELKFGEKHGLWINARDDRRWFFGAGDWWNRHTPEFCAIPEGWLITTTVFKVAVNGTPTALRDNFPQCPHLVQAMRELEIHEPGVGDADFPSLEPARQLKTVHIVRSALTDAGLKSVSSCRTIEHMYIGQSKGITAAGLHELTRLPLKTITLSGLQFDETALQSLAPIQTLLEVHIPKIIPAATVKEFERTHPGCKVWVPVEMAVPETRAPSP